MPILVSFCDLHGLQWDYSLPQSKVTHTSFFVWLIHSLVCLMTGLLLFQSEQQWLKCNTLWVFCLWNVLPITSNFFFLRYWQQTSTHLSFNIICKTYIPDHVLTATCQNRTYNQIRIMTMLQTQTIAFPLPNMRKTRQPNILRAAVIWKTAAQLFVVSKM